MKLKLARNKQPARLKGSLLYWGDAPTSSTGFGVVAKNILPAVYKAGDVDIDIVGVNFSGQFYDKKKFPYTILPASLGSDKDPYGNALLINSLKAKKYDVLFIVNDTFAVHQSAQHIEQLRQNILAGGGEPFKIVYYFPVDCHVLPHWTGMMDIADILVAYNSYGAIEAHKVEQTPNYIINHGVDSTMFHPISKNDRIQVRKDIFHLKDDKTFLWINVNRNSLRKDIAQTLLSFKQFKDKYPNSKLYLHTAVIDGKAAGGVDIDLQVPCRELGLDIGNEVMFPNRYSPVKGVPEKLLNALYCCADGYITTTKGEGWGLTATEAMSCGVPIVVPNSTSFPEIVGADGVRGYMYECKERTLFDSSGYRETARTEDVVSKMIECYEERGTEKQQNIVTRARKFAKSIDWSVLSQQWVQVFSKAFSISRLAEYKSSSAPEEI